MISNVIVRQLSRPPIERQEFEMCEHKGIGHPDTITDAVHLKGESGRSSIAG